MRKSFFLVATFLTASLIKNRTFKVILVYGMIAYVIGDSDMVVGFRLVGVEGVEASSVEEARSALHKALARSDVGLIILSEAYFTASSMQDEVDKIRQERVSPLIVELPASKGSSSRMQLSEIISKILGIKI
jgi:vacuolar-type H+-ATPase subunit F/Vma7